MAATPDNTFIPPNAGEHLVAIQHKLDCAEMRKQQTKKKNTSLLNTLATLDLSPKPICPELFELFFETQSSDEDEDEDLPVSKGIELDHEFMRSTDGFTFLDPTILELLEEYRSTDYSYLRGD